MKKIAHLVIGLVVQAGLVPALSVAARWPAAIDSPPSFHPPVWQSRAPAANRLRQALEDALDLSASTHLSVPGAVVVSHAVVVQPQTWMLYLPLVLRSG